MWNAAESGPEERALLRLFGAIACGDHPAVSRLLGKTPELATRAIRIGATRGNEAEYFFEEIRHYAYAGDTPLHFAAAAYGRELAEEFVKRGADLRARNRRKAEPLHYADSGKPVDALVTAAWIRDLLRED
jgi:anti-sigma factor RsiW